MPGRGTDALHQMASSLGIFPGMRVFITAVYQKNLAYILRKVNPCGEKCPAGKVYAASESTQAAITAGNRTDSGFSKLPDYVNFCNLLLQNIVENQER